MREINQRPSGENTIGDPRGQSSVNEPFSRPYQQPSNSLEESQSMQTAQSTQSMQSSQIAQPVQPAQPMQTQMSQVKYAGFWARWVALMIDGLVLSPIFFLMALGFFFGASAGMDPLLLGVLINAVSFLTPLLYFVIMTHKYGATLGKKAIGVVVVSEKSERLSVVQVILRETVGKMVSGIIFDIGYLMAAFTDKKRALHDMIASTVVVYKDPNKRFPVWTVIVAVIIPVLVMVGILAAIVLVSLNSARDKAFDASSEAFVSEVVISALEYESKKETFEGFVAPEDTRVGVGCSGDVIVNISSDGKMIAAFLKKCAVEDRYICVDSVNPTAQEVSAQHLQEKKYYCSDQEPTLPQKDEKVEAKDVTTGADKNGLSLDVSRDLKLIDDFRGIALGWQADAKLYKISRIVIGGGGNISAIFKSNSKPGKTLEIVLDPYGGIVSSTERNDMEVGLKWVNVSNLKISSSEAFDIGEKLLSQQEKYDKVKVSIVISLEYLDNENAAWIFEVIDTIAGVNVFRVRINATNGEAEIVTE